MGSIALWALVIALGLQTGAGIYETRVIVPLWADVPQRFFAQPLRPDSGKRLWIILSPILSIISIINLIYAFGAMEPKRTWWIAASEISVAVMIVTFAYSSPRCSRSRARVKATTSPRKRRRGSRSTTFARSRSSPRGCLR